MSLMSRGKYSFYSHQTHYCCLRPSFPGVKTTEDKIGNKQIAQQTWNWSMQLLEGYFFHVIIVSGEIPKLQA